MKFFVDRGFPPQPAAFEIKDSLLKGVEDWGGEIKVAGEYTGELSPGQLQQGVSQLLASNQNVDGISAVGECSPAFAALKTADWNRSR